MAAEKIVHLPRRGHRRQADERAFLPAALEIVETPPSPIGQAIGLSIVAMFCIALAWASFGKIDIITSAPGKIVASDRTKLIQPFETGVVRAIHVQDGQIVKAGDLLIELDPTINQADSNRLKKDLLSAQLDVARLRVAVNPARGAEAAFVAPAGAEPEQIQLQRSFLSSQLAEYVAKLAALQQQETQKKAERATVQASVAKLDATIPLVQERVEIRRILTEQALSSKLTYLETLQLLRDQESERVVQESRLWELDAAIAVAAGAREQADAEYRRSRFSELAEAERKAASLNEELIKAEQRTKYQALTAPVGGIVQQLAIHTVGGVVSPAQQLLAIVPAESGLEIEAMIPNRDIGFVLAGQDVEIKVDTFSFTRYGLLHGKVLSVSQDSIARQLPPEPRNERSLGAENNTSEPRGQELVYSARISLDRTKMQIEDRLVNLTPGMAVTVDIKNGSRAIISYLLSPLLRYQHDSLRER